MYGSRASYQDLDAWRVSMDLVEAVYRLTQSFPKEEKFEFTSQIRTAGVSVPANIAEGYGRSHRGDYLHHLSIARGSAREVETLLLLAGRLGFASDEQLAASKGLCERTGQLLTKLICSLDGK